MKKTLRSVIAVILALVMVSGSFVCFADGLNEDAVKAHRGQYKKYVLLGDSAASGYRDVITENDDIFNKQYQETVYCRVPGSYADVLTKAIIEDNTMTAFAAPGFRTIEIRYMLEDDFDESDEYMFHPAQLDAVGNAGSEEYRAAYKKAIAEADLITLGVGGNDWGAFLGWVVADVFEAENVADKYKEELTKILESMEMGPEMVEKLVDLAHTAGALPALAATVPTALAYGLGNFYKNWDIMIQDIYDLNPDVTLMVISMSDNGVKGKYYDYEGVVGEPVNSDEAAEPDELTKTIVEFIMTVGNGPMVNGAKKFGYTYVDIAGATYVESHPDAAGHVYIANKIIEALPDYDIINTVDDVKPGHKYYNDVEYVLKNDLMALESEGKFNPEAPLTVGQFNYAFNKINGTDNDTTGTESVTVEEFALKILDSAAEKDLMGMIKGIFLACDIFLSNLFNTSSAVTRGEAANYIARFDKI